MELDSPRFIKGLDDKSQFFKIGIERITEKMKEVMSVVLDFEMDSIIIEDKTLGYIRVDELNNKPVICKKNDGDILKEGSIYYRHAGRTDVIGYGELRDMLEDIKHKERENIIRSFNAIIRQGPENIQILNTSNGVITWNEHVPIIISEELLSALKKEVKFIESGKFVKTGGDPTLKVIGSLESANVIKEKTNVNVDYPFLTSDLCSETGLNLYQMVAVLHYLNIYGDSRYNQTIKTSRTSTTKKFSQAAMELVKSELNGGNNKKRLVNKAIEKYRNNKK